MNIKKTIYKLVILLACIVTTSQLLVSCAKKGNITGGPKDELPPILVKATPEQGSINITPKEISWKFNEYIVANSPKKNFIFTPSIIPSPIITPNGSATKNLRIKFKKGSIEPNTTYTISSTEAIKDYNEGNPLSLQYTFSTGNHIDSLSLSGHVIYTETKKIPKNISIGLFELNEKYHDTLIYHQIPKYISSTTPNSNEFTFNYLKEGKYRIIALDERNIDYKYQPDTDKAIGFLNDTIHIVKDSILENPIRLFKARKKFILYQVKQKNLKKLITSYSGRFPKEFQQAYINYLNSNKAQIQEKLYTKIDSIESKIYHWINEDIDSIPNSTPISIIYKQQNNNDTLNFRWKNHLEKKSKRKKETLEDMKAQDLFQLSRIKNTADYFDPLEINSDNPLKYINHKKVIVVKDNDTINDFKLKISKDLLSITTVGDLAQDSKYQITFEEGSVIDIYGNENKMVKQQFSTTKTENYGSLEIKFNPCKFHRIIKLNYKKDDTETLFHLRPDQNKITIKPIKAGTYTVQSIEDKNHNGIWDTGDYDTQQQPEPITYFEKEIVIQANWEVTQSFIDIP